MIDEQCNPSSVDRLFQRYISGEISEDDARLLLEQIEASPELRVRLFEQIDMHALLEEIATEEPMRRDVIPVPSSPFVSQKKLTASPRRRFRLAAASAIALVVLLVLGLLPVLRQDTGRIRSVAVLQTVERPEPSSSAVAVVSALADTVWDEQSGKYRQDQFIEPGWLRLRSGLVSLRFFNGAEVVIAGPAEIEVVSVDHIQCRFGNINVNIPPQAQGFLVSAPQMVVKDLGTSFAVSVSHRGTEVHVAKGEVELYETVAEQKNLVEGEALFVAAHGAVRRFQANDDIFAPTRSLKSKTKEYQRIQYEKWKSRSNRFDVDRHLSVHFTFEDFDGDSEVVLNGKPNSKNKDGLIVGCRKAEGRWFGKQAVEFSRTSDRIRIRPFESGESITLSAWVRVGALEHRSHALFVAQDGEDKNRENPLLQWSVLPSGALSFEIDSPIPSEEFRYESIPYFKPEFLGQWTHVALVVDGLTQTVTHYVNGTILGSPHAELPFKEALPLSIGTAEIGNVSPLFLKRSGTPIRNFCGCIDEFHFFTRPLSPEEIWDLYDPVPNWNIDLPDGE